MPCQGSCKNTYWHGGLMHANVIIFNITHDIAMSNETRNLKLILKRLHQAFLSPIFRTFVHQLARCQLAQRIAGSLCDSWAICTFSTTSILAFQFHVCHKCLVQFSTLALRFKDVLICSDLNIKLLRPQPMNYYSRSINTRVSSWSTFY